VLESSVDFSNAATKSYLLSNLFDLFFFHFLNSHDSQILERNFSDDVKASRGVTDIATESMIIDTVKSSRIDHAALVKALSGNPSGTVEKEVEVEKDGQKKKEEVTEGSTADLSAAATAIVNLRRTMSDIPRTLPSTTATTSTSTSTSAAAVNQSTDPHPSPITTQDPRIAMQYSFIETVSLVYLLKSCQQGLSLPLPWVHSVALKSCLELILAGDCQYYVVSAFIFLCCLYCLCFHSLTVTSASGSILLYLLLLLLQVLLFNLLPSCLLYF
jgi:hypothetical protein